MWLVWLLFACDDTLFGVAAVVETDPNATGWCAVEAMLPSCTPCHSAAGAAGGLDLETDPWAAMVDVNSVAYGVPLVAPGDAEGSLLIRKIEGAQAGNEGGVMPPGGLLDGAVLAKVRQWVDDGADDLCDITFTGTGGGYHPDGWEAPDVHGMAAKFQTETDCRSCHGDQLQGDIGPSCESCHGAGWETTCTFCHGGTASTTGAPPEDIDDNTDITLSPYRPHTKHLAQGDHADIPCNTCHVVPTSALTAGHLFDDDTPGLAEVTFSGLATGGTWNGATCTVYCHGTDGRPGSVDHTSGPRDCGSCHGSPTTPGKWDAMSGDHGKHLDEGIKCSDCHGGIVSPSGVLLQPDRHVDGVADVQIPINFNGSTCTGVCHGENHNGRNW